MPLQLKFNPRSILNQKNTELKTQKWDTISHYLNYKMK